MSRSHQPIPKHCHHKASDCGVVRLSGVDHYTAKRGTPEAEDEYERLIAKWLANGRSAPADNMIEPVAALATPSPTGPTANDVILAFWQHAQEHYRDPDGTVSRRWR